MKKLTTLAIAALLLAGCARSAHEPAKFDPCPDAALVEQGYTLLSKDGKACIKDAMGVDGPLIPAAALGAFAWLVL